MATSATRKEIGINAVLDAPFFRAAQIRYPRLFAFFVESGIAILYIASYWLLDRLSFLYISDTLDITPWNPPVAASIILLLMRGLSWSPLLFVASLSYQVLFENLGVSLGTMIMTSSAEALIYTAAVWAITQRFRIDRYLSSLRDVTIFCGTILAASGCMAISYILSYYVIGLMPDGDALRLMAQYWAGDFLGIVILVPLFMLSWRSLQMKSLASPKIRLSLEMMAQIALTIFVIPFVFLMEKNDIHMFYLFFIPLVWAAITGGIIRATWITLLSQLVIVFSCWRLQISAHVTLTFLPFIMSVIACMGLILGSVIDEKERAKLSNLKSDARLKAILDMAPDSMMIVDTHGHIVATNKLFLQTYGAKIPSVLINQHIKKVIPTFYADLNGETFLFLADGSDIPIEISSSKVPVGDRYSTILTIRDISDRKRVESQMRQRRAVTEQATRTNLTGGLAAVLAHELNQPLSAIMSYASACANIVASMDSPPPRVTEQLAKVAVQARRAGDIIRRLREFFQNSSIEVVKVDMRELINESIMLLEDDLALAQVDVEVSIGEPLVAAIDRIQIEQVLINLIKNSVEAVKDLPKEKKRVRIAGTQSLRGDIEIVVTDTGPGIAPEIVDQLFSPFVTTRLSGMGLGLTISRSIVEAHNGRLWAELQSSSGAAMHFTVPAFNREI